MFSFVFHFTIIQPFIIISTNTSLSVSVFSAGVCQSTLNCLKGLTFCFCLLLSGGQPVGYVTEGNKHCSIHQHCNVFVAEAADVVVFVRSSLWRFTGCDVVVVKTVMSRFLHLFVLCPEAFWLVFVVELLVTCFFF